MIRRVLFSVSIVALASFAIVAHAQQPRAVVPIPTGPTRAPLPTTNIRLRVPPAFTHVTNETATVNGHAMPKRDLLAQVDPAKVVTLPSGKSMTTQQLMDGVGRSEDKAIASKTTLRAIAMKKTVMVNPAARIAAQKQKVNAWRQRATSAKAGGWSGNALVHLSPGPAAPPDHEFTGTINLPPSRRTRLKRYMSPCAFYPGHAPTCTPDFSSIDAPPWSQDVGDRNVVGASTSMSVSGSTTGDGDQSTCSIDWDNSVQVFGTEQDMFHVVASETMNAHTQSFSGSLAVYIVGNAISTPDDNDEGSGGSLISESYGFSAGGNFPLIGPIYLTLKLQANATAQIALVGERRLTAGDPDARVPAASAPSAPPSSSGGSGTRTVTNHPPGGGGTIIQAGNTAHGTHCHVGVEPSLQTDVQLTTGIGFGIDDLVDLMHIEVIGEVKPIWASLPTHVTLDLQRAPPSGQIAFDSHLKATFMQSQLSFNWQIFDVCWSSPFGTVCLLHDILDIPTSGTAVIAQDEGFDPVDIDLLGGGRAIKWKPK
jgi:hypothetical protein